MNKQYLILIFMLISFLNLSCKNELIDHKSDYSQKANEIIQQIIIDESCDCVLEIPKKSMIEMSITDNPSIDFRKILIERLNLKSRKELDSLERLSDSFIMDSIFFKQNKIRVIKRDSLREYENDSSFLKVCPKGILSLSKPIFDKEYKKVALSYGYTFQSIPNPVVVYKFENGKWIE